MTENFGEICKGLRNIAKVLNDHPSAHNLLTEAQGWTWPAVSPSHVGDMAGNLADSLERLDIGDTTEIEDRIIHDADKTIAYIVGSVLPNLPGNLAPTVLAVMNSLVFLNAELAPLLGWDSTTRARLPSPLIRKLNQIGREVDGLIPDAERLKEQIALISDATESAEALPATMQELKATQAEIRQISSTSSELLGKIQELHKQVGQHVSATETLAKEGDALIQRASEAYRVTTTVGLAASFDERARTLNRTVYYWVGGLAVSLITLLVIGYFRLEDMRETFASNNFDPTRVWTQVALSTLSVGAPIWFAWLSTKQVGQRFRLAEDYAFKASVAKAYEGYRREANTLSPEFAQTLFGSALTRLDEAPLRLLDMSNHGSPIHEFLSSALAAKRQKRSETRRPTERKDQQDDSDAD